MRSIVTKLVLLLLSTAAFSQTKVNLATQVQGKLPVANGGTNATTAPAALTNLGASNASLSNLGSVAINTTLLPGSSAGAIKLGSASFPFGNVNLIQTTNGDDLIYGLGNTATSPTGNFLNFQQPGTPNATVYSVDVNGNETAHNSTLSGTLAVTGAITSSSSITAGGGAGVAGIVKIPGGTAATGLAGAWNITAPATVTGTPVEIKPSAAGTGFLLLTNSAGTMTDTIVGSTGSGNVVLATSPTLVTPALGTPSSATLTNATGLPVSTGVSGLGTGIATFLATPSSANLLSALTTKTGTGQAVFDTSPTLATPTLTTPSASALTLTDVATGTQCLHANSSGIVSGTGSDCGSGGGSTAGASLFSTTGSTTATAASATSLIGSVTGSTTVAANTWTAGSATQFFAQGYYTDPITPRSLTVDLKIGGTTRVTTGSVALVGNVTNGTWRLACLITTRTTGASGTQIANCIFETTGANLTPGELPMQTSSTWTIDTTAGQAIDLQATWDATTGSPSITSTNVAAWIPGAPVTSVNGSTGAITGLATLASPALTGTPTAPTASAGTNSTQIATTAYVDTKSAAPLQFSCTSTSTASQTRGMFPGSAGTSCTNTVTNPGIPMIASRTIKNLYVKCAAGGVNGSSGVFTILKNSSTTGITCTIGTGTSCNDTTNNTTVVAGDDINIQFTTQASETLASCRASVGVF